MKRWLAVLVLTGACARVASSGPRPATGDLRAILAAAGDRVLNIAGGGVLYAGDSLTIEALAPAARRLGRALAMSPGQVWCADDGATPRAVGITVAVHVDSMANERAVVGWSATCLMTPPGEAAPAAFGESGVYEMAWRDGRWHVSRALARLVF